MSRSGYVDDLDDNQLNVWRGAVASALRGKRGQRLLREMLAALDAMPDKRLVANALVDEDGEVCALGAAGQRLGLSIADLDPEDYEAVAERFGVARAMVQEIAYMNDEATTWTWTGESRHRTTPEERWAQMREWVVAHIQPQRVGEGSKG